MHVNAVYSRQPESTLIYRLIWLDGAPDPLQDHVNLQSGAIVAAGNAAQLNNAGLNTLPLYNYTTLFPGAAGYNDYLNNLTALVQTAGASTPCTPGISDLSG